ncbi:MAG: PA14 domain-containing protein [Candidatus Promineifilaceae bacterium]
MIWILLVGLLILAIVLVELGAWIRQKRAPEPQTAVATEETAAGDIEGDQTGADLARATMKIAVLESRLLDQSAQREAQVAEVEARYRKLMEQTEAAYQRQMVKLSARLAEKQQAADSAGSDAGNKEYEVRLANEVAAWLARFEDGHEVGSEDATSPVDEHTSAAEETSAAGATAEADAQEAAPDEGDGQEQSALLSGPVLSTPDEGYGGETAVDEWEQTPEEPAIGPAVRPGALEGVREWVLEAAPAYIAAAGVRAERDPWDTEAVAEVAQQITLLDEAGAEPLPESAQAAVKDAIKISPARSIAPNFSYHNTETETTAAGAPAPDRTIARKEDGRSQEAAPNDTAVAVADGWPERRSRAMQRAFTRRLGAELDADYLDDEEFAQALGINEQWLQEGILTAEQLEDIMGNEDWVMDPLQVMADYLRRKNGEGTVEQVVDQPEYSDEPVGNDIEASAWEQLVLAGPQVEDGPRAHEDSTNGSGSNSYNNGHDGQNARNGGGTNGNGSHARGIRPLELNDEEAAEVSAAVEAILSRKPEAPANGGPAVAPEPQGDDADVPAAAAEEETVAAAEPAVQQKEVPAAGAAVAEIPQKSADAVKAEPPAVPAAEPDLAQSAAGDDEAWRQTPESLDALKEALRQTSGGAGAPEKAPAAPEPMGLQEPDTVRLLELVAQPEPEKTVAAWEREPVIWEASYFNNTRLADEPAATRQDRDISFHWSGRAPAQGVQPRVFSVRWRGAIPLEEGRYRFTLTAPDGVRLWLNDRLIISAWYDQSEQTYQRDFAWQGGSVEVRVEHYENGGDAHASLDWERVA